MFVGVQHAGNLLHDFLGSESVVQPISDTHAARMIRMSRSIGIDIDQKMIIGSHFWIVQDLLTYGVLEHFFHLPR